MLVKSTEYWRRNGRAEKLWTQLWMPIFSLWFDPIGKLTYVYHFSSWRSIHLTTDQMIRVMWMKEFLVLTQIYQYFYHMAFVLMQTFGGSPPGLKFIKKKFSRINMKTWSWFFAKVLKFFCKCVVMHWIFIIVIYPVQLRYYFYAVCL